MRTLIFGLLAFAGLAPSVQDVAAQQTPDSLGALIRQLANSLRDGGARDGMVVVAADSASAALLRLADVPAVAAPGPAGLLCPASTGADGERDASPVGYRIQLALVPRVDTTTRELQITKSCGYRYRGSVRPFAEGGAWELRREGSHWRVTVTLSLWET